ncbi:MAG: magnesium/cobalt transporter CorA [Polyangiales bacterium]
MIVTRMASLTPEDELQIEQVTVVLGKDYVITFQEKYGDVLDPVRRRLKRIDHEDPKKAVRTISVYAILDCIIDHYYPVFEAIGQKHESLESDAMINPTPDVLEAINGLRTELLALRRSIWPFREVLSTLARDDSSVVSGRARVYFRDIRENSAHLVDIAESLRETNSGLLNTYLSMVGQRTNDIMKVLTIVSSIFIPLSFIAGLYGMNFQYMPELVLKYGYPYVPANARLGARLVALFRKQKWL